MLFAAFVLVFCPLACLFALWKGQAAERWPAAIILSNFLMATANYATARSQMGDLFIDAFTAIALLPITMQYASLWLGVVMLVYSLQFGMDAYYMVLERPIDRLHGQINNLNSFLIIGSLMVGALVSWLRQRGDRGSGAQPAAV